ncbi:hypothetical protein CEUSTIGMA_g1590.t1 [Chlamydomonas eustigma]|uniref:Uncharacterized protein n=1 Tax=Chlamydomonas eustigma TaxID=1157962 RepID=A0A250WTJ7_9CHLO|nr:hypothetical protein CEUSTIGMA_g1590.t1 [Chlamydomonas eustigma]|eukprot:GAX74141.1 hypothetical protein CEUSTIGMA_g1590.t1 [Chlamydomonas eustigma]
MKNTFSSDVLAFGGSPSARVRAKMYQLAAQLASACIELVSTDQDYQEDGTQLNINPDENSSLLSLIPSVICSSWDGFKQEMAGGTGSTAGDALELLLLVVQDISRLRYIPELCAFEKLPVPGPTLVSGLMTAYSYDPKVKASSSAKGSILEVLAGLLIAFPEELLQPRDKNSLGGFSGLWLLKEGVAVLQKKEPVHDYKAGAMAGAAAVIQHLTGEEGAVEASVVFTHIRHTLQLAIGTSTHQDSVAAPLLRRYSGVIAGLKLLSRSTLGGHIGALMVGSYTELLQELTKVAVEHTNKGLNKEAQEAVGQLFAQMCAHYHKDACKPGIKEEFKSVLQGLTSKLIAGDIHSRELRLTVCGLGQLAHVTKALEGVQAIKHQLQLLAPLVGEGQTGTWSEDAQLRDSTLKVQVELLSCLTLLLEQLPSITPSESNMCTSVAEGLAGAYLQLWPSQQPLVHGALLAALLRLDNKGTAVQVSGDLDRGPLALLLVQHPSLMEGGGTDAEALTSFQAYLPLWLALLKGANVPRYAIGQFSASTQRRVHQLIYQELIRAVVDACRNLDLSLALVPKGSEVGGAVGLPLAAGEAAARASLHGEPGTAATDTAVLAAMERPGAHLDAVGADRRWMGTAGSDIDTEDLAAEWPILSLANNAEDVKAFTFLASFLGVLLPETSSTMFKTTASSLLTEAVEALRTRAGLLPASYRLIAALIKEADRAGLLYDVPSQTATSSSSSSSSSSGGFIATLSSECWHCCQHFLQGLVTACRRYRGELLLACIELLLCIPPGSKLLGWGRQAQVLPLRLGLQLGATGATGLALAAVEALERWEQTKPKELQVILPYIVPLVEPYLHDLSRMTVPQGLLDVGHEMPEGSGHQRQEGGRQLSSAAEYIKDAEQENTGSIIEDYGGDLSSASPLLAGERESRHQAVSLAKEERDARDKRARGAAAKKKSLASIQPRLQLWLGRMGAAVGLLANPLVTTALYPEDGSGSSEGRGDAVHQLWDSEKRFRLDLPFVGFEDISPRPKVWLDTLLPRAAFLATSSPDRPVKVASCEFLHAATLWLVAQSAVHASGMSEAEAATIAADVAEGGAITHHAERHSNPVLGLLHRLLPVLLRLGASSSETVARQLFPELLRQMVRWYTRSALREAPVLMALMEAICSGLSREDVEGGSLRELAASLSADFLEWSLRHAPLQKQGSQKITLEVPSHVQSLLRRLLDQLSRPNFASRLGAALALRRCAPRLRNQGAVASAYGLELMRELLLALKAADADPVGLGTARQIAAAVDSVFTHVLLKHQHILMSEAPGRAGQLRSMWDLLQWLWERSSAPEHELRRKCMALHSAVASLYAAASGMDTEPSSSGDISRRPSSLWLHEFLAGNSFPSNEDREEAQERAVQKHLAVPPLALNGEGAGLSLNPWLRRLEAVLQWASWAFRQGLLTTSNLSKRIACSGDMAGLASENALTESINTYLGLLSRALHQLNPLAAANLKAVPIGSLITSGMSGGAKHPSICTIAGNECRDVALKLSDFLLVTKKWHLVQDSYDPSLEKANSALLVQQDSLIRSVVQ